MLTSIIRQHPSIQSLSDETLTSKIETKNNHSLGFSEDYIWKFLDNYNNDVFKGMNEGFLWADPKYIYDFTKDDYYFKEALKYEIQN